MIKKLLIKNFKSIKDLGLDCRKINLFIGEPNTGKSNILEALGLLSWCGQLHPNIGEFVRMKSLHNIFYDDLVDQPIMIQIDDTWQFKIHYERDLFKINVTWEVTSNSKKVWEDTFGIEGPYRVSPPPHIDELEFIKLYKYKNQNEFPEPMASFLLPPHGANMYSVVAGNQKLRELMGNFFKPFNLNLQFRPVEKTFEVQKQINNLVFSYPYLAISETLRRIIFYTIAMESNINSTLIFEEPESHAFPYYTKHLGESIAFDETNQYFITTHNPYLLLSIFEKAEKDSVNVFITYLQDYQTKVKCLNNEEISELMDYDPFFNLNSFIEKENE